jgi:hypothetical protein
MQKIFMALVLSVSMVWAIDKVTTTYTAVPHASILASGTNANVDSLKNAINRTIDTCNNNIPRWKELQKGDSTFDTLQIKRIRNKTQMDTIVDLDSIYSDVARFKRAHLDTVGGPIFYKELGASYFNHNYTINDTTRFKLEFNSLHDALFTTFGGNLYFRRCIGGVYATVMKLDSADTSCRIYGRTGIGKAPSAYRLDVNGVINSSGIHFGGDSTLTNYNDTAFYDSIYVGGVYKERILCRIIRTGNVITMFQNELYAILSTTSTITIRGIPSQFNPSKTTYSIIYCTYGENGNIFSLLVFYEPAGTWTLSPSISLNYPTSIDTAPTCLTWIK